MFTLTALNVIPRILTVALLIMLYLLAALILLVLVALLIPFQYQLKTHFKDESFLLAKIRYAFLRFDLSLTAAGLQTGFQLFGWKINPGSSPKKAKVKQKREKGKRSKRQRKRPGRKFITETKRLICSIYRATRPRVFSATGTYSLADPADIALVAMLFMGLAAALPRADISLQPDFINEVNDARVELAGRIVPIVLVFYVIRFMLKKEVRQVLIGRRIR